MIETVAGPPVGARLDRPRSWSCGCGPGPTLDTPSRDAGPPPPAPSRSSPASPGRAGRPRSTRPRGGLPHQRGADVADRRSRRPRPPRRPPTPIRCPARGPGHRCRRRRPVSPSSAPLQARGHHVVAVDADPRRRRPRLADESHVVPRGDRPALPRGAAARRHVSARPGPDVHRRRGVRGRCPAEEYLDEAGVRTLMPTAAAVATCLDKWAFHPGHDRGRPAGPGDRPRQAEGVPGPWIVKPRFGRGSRGRPCRRQTRTPLRAALRRCPTPLVQTQLTGPRVHRRRPGRRVRRGPRGLPALAARDQGRHLDQGRDLRRRRGRQRRRPWSSRPPAWSARPTCRASSPRTAA